MGSKLTRAAPLSATPSSSSSRVTPFVLSRATLTLATRIGRIARVPCSLPRLHPRPASPPRHPQRRHRVQCRRRRAPPQQHPPLHRDLKIFASTPTLRLPMFPQIDTSTGQSTRWSARLTAVRLASQRPPRSPADLLRLATTVERKMWVVNGQIEGPLLEANQGESCFRSARRFLPLPSSPSLTSLLSFRRRYDQRPRQEQPCYGNSNSLACRSPTPSLFRCWTLTSASSLAGNGAERHIVG